MTITDSTRENQQLLSVFAREVGAPVRHSVAGASLTTWKIGGPIKHVVSCRTVQEVQAARRFLLREGIPSRPLGGGSNILISDQGLNEWVLTFSGELRNLDISPLGRVRVGAGASLMRLSSILSRDGWSGFEFAGGIPAQIGGALVMNAGAHGRETGDLLKKVFCVDESGELCVFQASELARSYRHGGIPGSMVVVEGEFIVTSSQKDITEGMRTRFLRERKTKQPLRYPSAGSVFRNPSPSVTAGFLIEACGLKGSRVGGAQVSDLHANWILNDTGGALAADVLSLIEMCKHSVSSQHGVALEQEVKVW